MNSKQPLRVLQVVESALTGVGRHLFDLTEGLVEMGHSVHLIYSPDRMDRAFERRLEALTRRSNSFAAHPLSMRRGPSARDPLIAATVARYVRNHGPFQLVHGHSSKGGAIARLAGQLCRLPSVYTPHAIRTMNPFISPLERRILTTAERTLARMSGAVIAVSYEEGEHLVETLRFPAHRVRVVVNGIERFAHPDRDDARRTLQIPRDIPVAGFVGRLSDQKGLDVLLKAWQRVLTPLPQARLAIVGHGELEQTLRRLALELGVDHAVDWLGEQVGVEVMPAFDVLAFPSRYEGLSYVLLEALVIGLPVVASDKSSAGTAIDDGSSGYIHRVNDDAALSEHLTRLLSDPDLCAEFGWSAQNKVESFGVSQMIEQTLDVYYEITGHDASHVSGGARTQPRSRPKYVS
ncbi:MAG: glycosyltransferase family 4 protein [Pirellulaceae bacterium]